MAAAIAKNLIATSLQLHPTKNFLAHGPLLV
jgi:hypothetical protein